MDDAKLRNVLAQMLSQCNRSRYLYLHKTNEFEKFLQEMIDEYARVECATKNIAITQCMKIKDPAKRIAFLNEQFRECEKTALARAALLIYPNLLSQVEAAFT